jgi:hypothetical protein
MIDASPGDHPDEVTRRLAPIGHKHINMRGILNARHPEFRSRLPQVKPAATLLHGSAGWRRELGGVGRRPLP